MDVEIGRRPLHPQARLDQRNRAVGLLGLQIGLIKQKTRDGAVHDLQHRRLTWRHDGNIRKLLAGTESRLGQKTAAAAPLRPAAHLPETHHHDGKHRKGHH